MVAHCDRCYFSFAQLIAVVVRTTSSAIHSVIKQFLWRRDSPHGQVHLLRGRKVYHGSQVESSADVASRIIESHHNLICRPRRQARLIHDLVGSDPCTRCVVRLIPIGERVASRQDGQCHEILRVCRFDEAVEEDEGSVGRWVEGQGRRLIWSGR